MDHDGPTPAADGRLPLRDVVAVLTRWWWFVAAVVVVLAGAVALTSGAPDGARATVLVNLTTEVQWPFFDSRREEVARQVDEALEATVAGTIGLDDPAALDLVVDVPVSQSFLRLTASTPDPDTAVAAAGAAADVLVTDARERSQATTRTELDTIVAQLEVSRAGRPAAVDRVAELTRSEEVARAELATATPEALATAQATFAAAQAARLEAESDLRDRDARDDALVEQRSMAELTLAGAGGPVEVLGDAELEAGAASGPVVPLAVAVVVGALLGLAGARGLDAVWGPVRGRRSAEASLGLPVVDATEGGGWARAALRLGDLAEGRPTVIGVAGPGAGAAIDRLVAVAPVATAPIRLDPDDALDPVRARTRMARAIDTALAHGAVALVELGDDVDEALLQVGPRLTDSILAGCKGRTRRSALVRAQRSLGRHDLAPAFAVLVPAAHPVPTEDPRPVLVGASSAVGR